MPRKREKLILSWSGGKDSALCLFELKCPDYDLAGLLTTVVENTGRVKMHDVRQELIDAQAGSLELPITKVFVSENCSNEEYEAKMGEAFKKFQDEGVKYVAFGDLFLEDIRKYRDKLLAKYGLKGVYPLWKWKSHQIQQAVFGLGYKAVVTSVDLKKLPKTFVGRAYDKDFLDDLPTAIDPCGENGEFHTFVYNGLLFQEEVKFSLGDIYQKDTFAFQDLKPEQIKFA